MAVISPIVPTPSTSAAALEKAEAAKQKGNDLFKKGQYADSIGHYSQAHVLVPSSPIYPLNRAQAYINLEKYADADRDCSKSIALDDKNPKAWFRRGVARRGLGQWKHAREDFATVVKLDSKMAGAVKVELQRVKVDEEVETLKRNKGKKAVVPSKPAASSTSVNSINTTSTPPRSYAVPIKMVYPSTAAPPPPAPSPPVTITPSLSSTPTLTPPLSSSSPPPPSSSRPDPTASIFPTEPKPKPSFASLQSARKNAKPALPSHSLPSAPKAFASASTSTSSNLIRPRPTSAHALHKTLLAIGDDKKEAFEFVCSLPPSSLPSIIGASLEPALFESLLRILEAQPPFAGDQRLDEVVRALEVTPRVGLARIMVERGEERWAGLGRGKGKGAE